MAVLFFEGFETIGTEVGQSYYATIKPRIDMRWDYATSGSSNPSWWPFIQDDMYSEGYAYNMGKSEATTLYWYAPASWFSIGAGTGAPIVTVGALMHIPSATYTSDIIVNNGDYGAGPHDAALSLQLVNSTDLAIYRQSPCPATLGTASAAVSPGSWHYIEWQYQIADSPNGWCKIRVDDVEVGNFTGLDTNCGFSTAATTSITFRGPRTSGVGEDYLALDDIYIADAGTVLGAVRVRSLPPISDVSRDWANSGGTATNYDKIDENGADDTDYIETDQTGYLDVYELTNTDTNYPDPVYAVKAEAEAINTTGGEPTLTFRLISGASIEEEEVVVDDTVNYDLVTIISATDPATGSAWTVAGVDAVQLGLEFSNGYEL